MANTAASTKLGLGYGPTFGNPKIVCVSFATTATADVLIFDASNVGKENALSKIVWALVLDNGGAVVATNAISSNQITIGTPVGATQMVAVCFGIGG